MGQQLHPNERETAVKAVLRLWHQHRQGSLWPGGDHDFTIEGLKWDARGEPFEVTYETSEGHQIVDRWELILHPHQKTVSLVSRTVTPGESPFVVIQS